MAFLITDLLDRSASQCPEKMAVVCANERFTYQELATRVDAIANTLLASGLQPGDRVGVYAPRSARTIAAQLGVAKAGGVYIPLEALSPPSRIRAICEDCQISMLFTRNHLAGAIDTILAEYDGLRWIGLLDETIPEFLEQRGACVIPWNAFQEAMAPLSRPKIVEDDLVYILYTSGSTGTPKGVMLTHRNVLAYVDWAVDTFSVKPTDRLANHAPFYFDISTFDIYASIACKATLHIVPPEIASFPYEIVRWMEKEQITIWYSVPSILKMILLHGKIAMANLSHLRLILFAGEVFPIKYLRMLVEALPAVRFCNLYGPTETNICTYYWVPEEKEALTEEIPLGKACEHSDVFLLRADNTIIQQPGEEGELCVRGATVMRGYWNNAAVTARVMQDHLPETPHLAGPIYHTGDIVRLDENGLYHFLGRRDHMIKSRGYRIELGEIESVLNASPLIEQAVVVPLPDELIGTRLEACVVEASQSPVDIRAIQHYCAQFLPHYMVPEQFHIYTALPLTPTGKADRSLLRQKLLAPADA